MNVSMKFATLLSPFMHDDVLQLYRTMESANISLAFKGAMSERTLVNLAGMLKQQLGGSSPQNVIKAENHIVFAVFVELAQNILNYSAETSIGTFTDSENNDTDMQSNEINGIGMITIRETANEYIVSSGNAVTTQTASRLVAWCDHLNTLDKDDLKRLYKERLHGEPPEGSKGAGLGLIDIARKSGVPLDYAVSDYAPPLQLFMLNVVVRKISSSSLSPMTL
jgi:hypothetical protein